MEAFPEIRFLKAFIIYPATLSVVAAAAVTPPSTGLLSPRRLTGRLKVEEKEEEDEVGEVAGGEGGGGFCCWSSARLPGFPGPVV